MTMTDSSKTSSSSGMPRKKKVIDHRTLRVSNLPSNVTIQTIFDYFSRCSIPVRIYLHDNKTAAFVEFSSERDAAEALALIPKYYPFLQLVYGFKTRHKGKLNHMAPPYGGSHVGGHGGHHRTAAEDRRLIQRALDIVYRQRLIDCGNCIRCGISTTKKCSNCGTYYCSKECQLIDWNNHQDACILGSQSLASEFSSAPKSLMGNQFDRRNGRFPVTGSEAPQHIEGFRHISHRTSHSIETSHTVKNADSGRSRIADDTTSVVNRSDDHRRRRSDEDKKPLRSFRRNFDSESNRGSTEGSKKFSSNRSEAGSTRGEGRRDRDRNRGNPKRFDTNETEVKEVWDDSPTSPTPENKENLEPENKFVDKRPRDKSPPVEKIVKKEAEVVENTKEVLSVFGLVRESPDSYWFITADQMDHWQNLQVKVQDECASASKIKPSLGLICGCFYDDMWYRGKIIALEPKIKVHYIDYGNCAEYDSDFKKLSEELATEPQLAFLVKFAKGTPKNFETQSLDGETFPIEIVKKTKDYSLVKFVGEKYSAVDDEEEVPEVPKNQEKVPEKEERPFRRDEKPPRREETSPRRDERPPRREERSPRREERSSKSRERSRSREEKPQRKEERKNEVERKPEEAPKRLKKPTRENVFDYFSKDCEGAVLMLSNSDNSLFGCFVPNSDDKFAMYFENLESISPPSQPFSADEGDFVISKHLKGYDSRGVVLSKSSNSYLVSLVDYASTVTAENVYEVPEKVKDFAELGAEFVIEELMDENFDLDLSDQDQLFTFMITGASVEDKWPCTLKVQISDLKPPKAIVKGYVKRWNPLKKSSKTLKSGSVVVLSALLSYRKSYVRLASPAVEKKLTEIGEKLQTYSKSAEKYREPPKVGELCSARYVDDENFYRAIVESINKNMVSVRFIDYGNDQETRLQDLVVLSEELKNIPPFAYEIELKGVKDNINCPPLTKYFTGLNAHSAELILTYEGDIKDGVILTEKSTGVVVNDHAREKIAAMKK